MIEAKIVSHSKSCEEAELYIWTLTHENKYDWRFPTRDERDELTDGPIWCDSLIKSPYIEPLDRYYLIAVRTIYD
jgi:hypothetical protein